MHPLHQSKPIALPWLARLRWIAVVGQVAATLIAVLWLKLELLPARIAVVIAITAITNLAIQVWHRRHSLPEWIVPAIILLDVCMFTVLLYLTGGTDNPFCILYAIHVAMAVVVAGGAWAWLIVLLSAVSYAVVGRWHLPLTPAPSDQVQNFGQWSALVLVMALTAYFIGRVMGSLRMRERELANARERASRHEHLASLTTLAAGAAHELGTPLGTIALVAKEMERAVDSGSMLADDARLIRQEVERCRAILERMRVDVLEDVGARAGLATFDELVEGIKSDLHPPELERLRIETSEAGDEAIWRSRVLRRAIGVLLHNAFEASPPNGMVKLLFQRRDDVMIFEVQDSGAGMTEQVLRRAGEPFFTTKPPGSGMGLGLFLVRLIADTYGGRFELQSSPGAGTRSILELPEQAPAEVESHEQAGIEENPRRGRRRGLPPAPQPGAGQPGV